MHQHLYNHWKLRRDSEQLYHVPLDMAEFESVRLPARVAACLRNARLSQLIQIEKDSRRQTYANSSVSSLISRKIISIIVHDVNGLQTFMPTIKSQMWMALDFHQYGDSRPDEYWTTFLTLSHDCPQMVEEFKRDGLAFQMRKMGSTIIQARLAEYLRLDDEDKQLSILADIKDDGVEQKRFLDSLRNLPTDAPAYLRINDSYNKDDESGRGRANVVIDPRAGADEHDNGKGGKRGGKSKKDGEIGKGRSNMPVRTRKEIDADPE